MTSPRHKNQVEFLLKILPEVAKENCFALHGGTAINLFIRNMPRISVDVDLTYLPLENRETSLKNIAAALERIKARVENILPSVKIQHKKNVAKLLFLTKGTEVKLEVNLVGRGALAEPETMTLCKSAQEEFDVFCAIQVAPLGQIYGGKICAALDRQHPRDLFDVKYLLGNEGFTDEIKTGFIFCLLGSDRPLNEVIKPNLQDQKLAMVNQFEGMTSEPFSYEEYEAVREKLIDTIQDSLTKTDKEFLLSFKGLSPRWDIYDFKRFPSVQWKLKNLGILKAKNPEKYASKLDALKGKLE